MIVTVTPNPVLDRTLTVAKIVLNDMARVQEVREDWGGKGFNVSRALYALGRQSLATGFVGGATGQKLTQGLHRLGIETNLVAIFGETRTNIVITDASGGPVCEGQRSRSTRKRCGHRHFLYASGITRATRRHLGTLWESTSWGIRRLLCSAHHIPPRARSASSARHQR